MSDTKYFNGPIQIINGIFEDKEKVLCDFLYYALYAHSLKLEDEIYNNSEFNRFMSAAKWYGVNLNANDKINKEKCKRGKELFDSIPANSPKVGLNISIFWDYFKNEKSDFDIACLVAFLAIKSILGTKPYCKTNNAFLWARMSGNSKAMIEYTELSGRVRHYANEYQTVKIKNALRESWGLVTYSRYTRGFYVSFSLDLKVLIMEAEKKRKSTKENQYKQHEKEILKAVLQSLNNTS